MKEPLATNQPPYIICHFAQRNPNKWTSRRNPQPPNINKQNTTTDKNYKLQNPNSHTSTNECLNSKINQKLSNHFWKVSSKFDAQITQTLTFWYAQYMRNHQKNILWPLPCSNISCTLCPNHEIRTWPHLFSICTHPHIERLHITSHNEAVDQVAYTLESNKHTMCYTLVNANNQHNRPKTSQSHNG